MNVLLAAQKGLVDQFLQARFIMHVRFHHLVSEILELRNLAGQRIHPEIIGSLYFEFIPYI